MKYIDKGEGSVILLIHGVPTSSWLYRKMIDGLAEKGHRVVAPDMLGYGSSANPDGYELYSQVQHAKRILELMAYLHINEWTHVMHDAGGLWTWELLKISPEKVTRLVILNTIIFEPGFNPPVKMKEGWVAKAILWLYTKKLPLAVILKSLFNDGLKKNNLSKTDIEGYKTPLLEGKIKGLYYFFSQTCNHFPSYDSVIDNLTVPVIVLWGKHDKMLRWEPQQEQVLEALKISADNVHELDAKHFIQEEVPEEINRHILEFVSI